MNYKKNVIKNLKENTKTGIIFFSILLIISILVEVAIILGIPVYRTNLFGGESLTQLVVLLGFYYILISLEKIIDLLITITDRLGESKG